MAKSTNAERVQADTQDDIENYGQHQPASTVPPLRIVPPNEPAVAGHDVFPEFAVSLDETERRIKMLQQYVREHMVDGEDYGIIPGSNKPTLFKAGAEKLNAVYGFAPLVTIEHRVENWDKGFLAYEVKVSLINKRTGQLEAEGVGSCNTKERRYARQDAPSIANTVLKMAKKRALVDATISATRASGLFAEDLEEVDGNGARPTHNRTDEAASPKPSQAPAQSANATPSPQQSNRNSGQRHERASTNGQGADARASERQVKAIWGIAKQICDGSPEYAEREILKMTQGIAPESLSPREASELIDRLRQCAPRTRRAQAA